MISLEAVIDRPGRTALRVTPVQQSLRWSSAAVGGYGSCTFQLPGDPAKWQRELPKLSRLRLVYDTFVVWEGQLEDVTLRLTGRELGAEVSCFGLQRLLSETGVRRVWVQRDIPWFDAQPGRIHTEASFGSFNDADQSQAGVRLQGTDQAVTAADFKRVRAFAPSGLTWTRWLGSFDDAGTVANFHGVLQELVVGVSTTTLATLNGAGAFDEALSANVDGVQILMDYDASYTNSESDRFDFYDMRLLGISATEDAAGGFHGGTILRDLLTLVPGLTAGIIADGSEFVIQSIARAIRDSALSVVEEVAGYYSKQWAVWDDGVFDWRARNLDEPQWVTTLAQLQDGTELTTTVDGLAETVYVLYTNAAVGLEEEASSASTDQRNPYVKQGKTKDELVQPGFPMTSVTAQQLAGRLVTDIGGYPLVEGRLVLPAQQLVRRANGPSLPALMIRAGETILVPDLPKAEPFRAGRDGETLFSIVACETDLETGQTVLEVEGQTRRSDVLLARLAAVTRTLTG